MFRIIMSSDLKPQALNFTAPVADEDAGQRLDRVAARLFADFSRSRLQHWIKAGDLCVDGAPRSVDYRLRGGEVLTVVARQASQGDWYAQQIEINIIFEDEHILVVHKPIDLVVHPAAGNWDGTLLNGLLFHCPQLQNLPRAGIVHRLDKNTSGLMVVAKTLSAHAALVSQLQARTVTREYLALVHGRVHQAGIVDRPVGRHPKIRTKMAVIDRGKQAVTHYRIEKHCWGCTFLRVRLETGRTHQIRVHLASINHPLIGDPVYGARFAPPVEMPSAIAADIHEFPRQALHAEILGLRHPKSGDLMQWKAPIPADMQELLRCLEEASE